MKVVLFCGGAGTRLREALGDGPEAAHADRESSRSLWHLMRYYAHFGHDEFILCPATGPNTSSEFFGDSDEPNGSRSSTLGCTRASVNAFAPSPDSSKATRCSSRTTATASPTCSARSYIDEFSVVDAVGSLLCVRPSQSFHSAAVDADGTVDWHPFSARLRLWINGGFFVFRQEIFDYLHEGEDLVDEPFQRLID